MDYSVKVTPLTSWALVLDLARTTVRKDCTGNEPSDSFKRDIIRSEHSPLRALMFRIDMVGIPYWVSVHLVRHKYGVEHFVSTQRTDRTGVDRDGLRQDAPVNHTMVINAQEILFVSRRRLCGRASPETHMVWLDVVRALREVDPVLAEYCVPMCEYRGGCFERPTCGHFSDGDGE